MPGRDGDIVARARATLAVLASHWSALLALAGPAGLWTRPPMGRGVAQPRTEQKWNQCDPTGAGAEGPYRSASASRPPSATKEPAKIRRSQVITRGLETTRSRTAAAKTP